MDFNPVANGAINKVALQDDGKILIIGEFTEINSISRPLVARLNTDGSLDEDFTPQFTRSAPPASLHPIFVQRNQQIVISGLFDTANGEAITNLARFDLDGVLDDNFNPAPNAVVLDFAETMAGELILGGEFTEIGGVTQWVIAKLGPDGTVDTDFDPVFDGAVQSVAIEQDGDILIGGRFVQYGTSLNPYFARLNPAGDLAESQYAFQWEGTGPRRPDHYDIALQSDGKILVAGYLKKIKGEDRHVLVRLNPDLSLDTSLTNLQGAGTRALAVDANLKIVYGGDFKDVSDDPDIPGVTNETDHFMRRDAGGQNAVSGFRINPYTFPHDGSVHALAVESNGDILVGGEFVELRGWLVNATDDFDRNRLARVLASGGVDPSFNPDVNGDVNSILLGRDGDI